MYLEFLSEIELILKEVMTKKRMNGSFKLMECKLIEEEDNGKKVFEEVNGFKAQKYQLNLKVKLDRNPTEVIEYYDLNQLPIKVYRMKLSEKK